MGCGGSRVVESGVNAPLNSHMEKVGIESIDDTFNTAGETIRVLEEIRDVLIDNKDNIYISTGACCDANPDFIKSFKYFLWKLSAENEGDFKKAELDLDPHNAPYLKLSGSAVSKESVQASNEIAEFIKGLVEIKPRLEDNVEKIKSIGTEIAENSPNFLDQIKDKLKDDFLNLPGTIKKLNRNQEKVKHAVEVAPLLMEEVSDTISKLGRLVELTSNVDEITKVNEVGKNAVKNKQKTAVEIVYHNLPVAERYGKSPNEGFQFYRKRKLNKAKSKEENKKK